MIVDSTVTGSWSSSPDGIFNGYLNGRVDGLVVVTLRIIDASNGGSEDIGGATGTISESGDLINGTFLDTYGEGDWRADKTEMPAWFIGDFNRVN